MTIVNYEVTFTIPEHLKRDVYVVSSENFLENFNRLFESYEEMGVDFSVNIKHTDTQIITK
jgi:pantothenate kinase type III